MLTQLRTLAAAALAITIVLGYGPAQATDQPEAFRIG